LNPKIVLLALAFHSAQARRHSDRGRELFSVDAARQAVLEGVFWQCANRLSGSAARVVVPYHPVFDAPLILLHASLAVRLLGDASGPGSGR